MGDTNGEAGSDNKSTPSNNLAPSSSMDQEMENGDVVTAVGTSLGNNENLEGTISCTGKSIDGVQQLEKGLENQPIQSQEIESSSQTQTNCVSLESKLEISEKEEPTSSTTPSADGKKQVQEDSEEDMSITEEAVIEPEVELRVIFNKQPMKVNISLKKTVGDLKKIIEKSTNVTPALMKVLVKGNAKDEVSLESLGLTNGSKVLIIGTSLSDVMKVAQKPTEKELQDDTEASSSNESKNWCSVPRHQKIIDKGIPEDVMPGISDCHDELPPFPISGMVGSKGSKVRLTFKLESDELWIGTKERTEKVPIGSVKSVISQPITGFEHYHIMAIQLGPTEASRFFIYWVPAQYVQAIKNALQS